MKTCMQPGAKNRAKKCTRRTYKMSSKLHVKINNSKKLNFNLNVK